MKARNRALAHAGFALGGNDRPTTASNVTEPQAVTPDLIRGPCLSLRGIRSLAAGAAVGSLIVPQFVPSPTMPSATRCASPDTRPSPLAGMTVGARLPHHALSTWPSRTSRQYRLDALSIEVGAAEKNDIALAGKGRFVGKIARQR